MDEVNVWQKLGICAERMNELSEIFMKMTTDADLEQKGRSEEDAVFELLAMADSLTTKELVMLCWKTAQGTVFLTHTPQQLMEKFLVFTMVRVMAIRKFKEGDTYGKEV